MFNISRYHYTTNNLKLLKKIIFLNYFKYFLIIKFAIFILVKNYILFLVIIIL